MITIGDVSTFEEVRADKAQALKVIEEAAEVFGAWQLYNDSEFLRGEMAYAIKKECADVIQATCNLLAAIGVEDFRGFMEDCKLDNEHRGRKYEGFQQKISMPLKEQMSIYD